MKFWHQYVKYYLDHFTPDDFNQEEGLPLLRDKLFISIILVTFPFCFVASVPSILYSIRSNHPIIGLYDTIAIFLLGFIFFYKDFSLRTKKILFSINFYYLATILIIYVGIKGPGFIILICTSSLITLFHSRKAGIFSVVANTIIVFSTMSFFLIWSPELFAYMGINFSFITVISFNIFIFNLLLVISTSYLIDNLSDSLLEEKKLQTLLMKESFDLVIAKEKAEKSERIVSISLSEQKKLNLALVEAEEKYRTVANFTYDWEYWTGTDGNIIYISPSCERISGFAVEDFIKDPALISNIIFEEDKNIWDDHKLKERNILPGEMIPELSFRIVTKTGEIRWIDHVCHLIFSGGKILGTRASNRDITEKVIIEKELFNANVEVEERERNRFARELHDGLGPVLSTVKLYFQWLAETDKPEKAKMITEKGNRNIDIAIQTAREIARGLSSTILINSGYIEALLKFSEPINETNKLIIDVTFNTKARFNYYRETTLYRISTELINNTLKYARASLVNISFIYHIEKNKIIFEYSDNGIGFNMDDPKFKNNGLGLQNIRQRISLIKGKISINSATGKGIKVYLEMQANEAVIEG